MNFLKPSPMNIRPRFTVRALFVLLTLAAAYFGCWELTKRAVQPVPDRVLLKPFDLEAHRATLAVDSEPGRGTEIKILLPIRLQAAPDRDPPAIESAAEEPSRATR